MFTLGASLTAMLVIGAIILGGVSLGRLTDARTQLLEEIGPAVRATRTVALAAPKLCHVLPPASALCGKVAIASVPTRSFDLSSKVPSCVCINAWTMGSPRPAPRR